MGQSKYNVYEADIATAYRLHPPYEDIVDGTYNSTNKLAIIADTEYRLSITTIARIKQNGFGVESGITEMFSVVDDKGVYSEFYNSPIIVDKPNCMFQPTVASAGFCTINVYVDETSPILIDQAVLAYKGSVPTKMATLFSYYLGNEVGFDIKNKGVYFTFSFTHNGDLWDMSLLQYLT